MAYTNLPGIFDFKVDGNLGQLPVNTNPIVLVVGTAGSGASEQVVGINTMASATKTFGKLGNLSRGIFEAATSGALNIRGYRICATSAKLKNIGGTGAGGYQIETVEKDDEAGTHYSVYYNDTTHQIIVYRVSDSAVVYDNNPSSPDLRVDLAEVSVTGLHDGTNPGNIPASGTTPVVLSAAGGVNGAVYVAGTDGTSPSKMALWEGLYKAYKNLADAQFDHIVPMGGFLDDANIQDLTTAQVTALQTGAPWAASGNTYPSPASSFDVLGKVFVQEYQGKLYFWWDLNRDGTAELWPVGVGASSATKDANNVTLTTGHFHEVNFGYDLARFCFEQSENSAETLGTIGMKSPNSLSLADVASWVGSAPVSSLSGSNQVISTNGTGLLGNKFMAGRKGASGSGLPAFSIAGVDGLLGGGFIAYTDTQFCDGGTSQKDENDKLVDLGKYISVVAGQSIFSNPSRDTAYIADGHAAYAGMVTSLLPNSAPTNKIIDGVSLPFRLNLSKLDALAGAKYVMFQQKPKGIIVSDAPTAARSQSDYNRLTTVRIVKAVLDAVRLAGDPFIGESMSGARLAALQTAIDQTLSKLTKAGFLQRYAFKVTATPADLVLGQAKVNLTLVPAFELRQILVTVSLAAA